MIEQRPIAWQIAELTASIARRKQRVAEATDTRFDATTKPERRPTSDHVDHRRRLPGRRLRSPRRAGRAHPQTR